MRRLVLVVAGLVVLAIGWLFLSGVFLASCVWVTQ